MSNLQIGLLIAGAVAVAGVFLYNWAQERRAARSIPVTGTRDHPDPLLPVVSPGTVRQDPDRAASESPPGGAAAIEYSLTLILGAPADRRRIEEMVKKAAAGMVVPVRIAAWQGDASMVDDFALAVPLLRAGGGLTEAEIVDFRAMADRLAVELPARVEGPGIAEAMMRRQMMTSALEEADIEVVIEIRPQIDSPLTLPGIMQAAGGRFELSGGDTRLTSPAGFSVLPRAVQGEGADPWCAGAVLVLPVPLVAAPEAAFGQMAALGDAISEAHRARMTDADGRTLDEAALRRIGMEVQRIDALMRRQGLIPGSQVVQTLLA